MAEERSCPVCLERFAAADGAAFALHVASCSSVSPPGSPTAPSHCKRCLHVYAAGTLPHEISFHEHECGRVNELPESEEKTNTPRKKQKKSQPVVQTPSVTLFPSTCFLCGGGGRGLLHCGGSCARAAHQNCVDALQAPQQGAPLTGSDKKQAHDSWRCAQCVRGLQRCKKCGFLGHEGTAMRKCAVLDCGYYFHDWCPGKDETVHAGFVCERHTCDACGQQELDMRRCRSCTVCFNMTHLRCPRGAGGATSTADASGVDPGSLFVCPRHDGDVKASPISSPDASNSLRLRLAPGDVVLVLEFTNALLPSSAKEAAPHTANHWGVVISAEETEPHGLGNQLLNVRMFVDDAVLVVPNRYVLRVAAADDFSRPTDLIRHCLQRHVMAELQIRQQEGDIPDTEINAILRASNAAFAARMAALGITETQAMADAEQGLSRWRSFQALPAPRQYDGLGDAAPIYLYVDTRGSRLHQHAADSANSTEAAADGEGDVSMTDADTHNTPGARGSAGPWGNSSANSTPTTGTGRGPHDSTEDESQDKVEDSDKTVTSSSVMVLDAQQTTIQKQAPIAVGSTPSTQDTETQSTQDTQIDSEPSSQSISPPATVTKKPDMVDANSSKRPAESSSLVDENIKRPKIGPTIATAAVVAVPSTHAPLVTPASNGLAPPRRHISPMAGVARTRDQQSQGLPPKKRQQLTRKQRLLAEMPPLVLEELEREAMAYLDGSTKQATATRVPSDADAFPWAARAEQFRPAFYQPAVLLGHSGLRRPGVEAVSRLLVGQDKRSITCFVQAVDAGSPVSLTCSHSRKDLASPSSAFLRLDLLGLRSFRELEVAVRTRLVRALGERARYTEGLFKMNAHQALRRLEEQRHSDRDQTPLSIWYCTAHGSRHRLELNATASTGMKAWLCFCANVHHLSAILTLPAVEASAPTAIAAQPQLPVASSVK